MWEVPNYRVDFLLMYLVRPASVAPDYVVNRAADKVALEAHEVLTNECVEYVQRL
jgi:hypothetical protein